MVTLLSEKATSPVMERALLLAARQAPFSCARLGRAAREEAE